MVQGGALGVSDGSPPYHQTIDMPESTIVGDPGLAGSSAPARNEGAGAVRNASFLATPPAAETPPPATAGSVDRDEDAADASRIVDRFISAAEARGLPVKMLRELRRRGYRIKGGAVKNHVSPWFNSLNLTDEVLSSLAGNNPLKGIVHTFYHEATHAWFDLNSDRRDVAALQAASIDHYEDSPLEQGNRIVGTADDPERIFLEAAATYVEHRVTRWLRTVETLEFLAHDPDVKPELIAGLLEELKSEYDAQMAQRVFGYEMEGGVLGFGAEQSYTTRPLLASLRAFLNRELLEGRIADRFDEDKLLQALARMVSGRAR
jgi:hypothetical protein